MKPHYHPRDLLLIASLPIIGIGIYMLFPSQKVSPRASVSSQPRTVDRPTEIGTKAERDKKLAELRAQMQEQSDAMVRSAQAAASREPITTYEAKLRPATLEFLKTTAENRFGELFDSWGMSKEEARRVVDAYVAKRIGETDAVISHFRVAATVTDRNDPEQLDALRRDRTKLSSAQDLGDAELLVILGQERFDQLMEVDRQVNEQNRKAAAAARE